MTHDYDPDANIYLFAVPKIVRPERNLWGHYILIADNAGEIGHYPEQSFINTQSVFRSLDYPECKRCGETLKPEPENLPFKIGVKLDMHRNNLYGDVTQELLQRLHKYCWDCKKHIERKKITAKRL